MQLDPLTDDYPYYTPYQFAGCEPIANVDIDGLEPANVVNGIWNIAKEGGVSITAKVITGGAYAGMWSVSWAKNGVLFSKVFKATGFLTQNVISAAERFFNLVSKGGAIANNLINTASRGDIPQTFGVIKDEKQLAFQAYSQAMNELKNAYENGWHRIPMGDPGNVCSMCHEGGEVNDITGQRRAFPTAITPVYPETVFLPLPKMGFVFKWLGKSVFGKVAAKEITNLIPEGKLANHLFKGAGKLADNPANRSLIQNISNGKAFIVDKFGKSWYKGVDGAGKGIYSYTQNGIVKGAGYTDLSPADIIIKYNLK